MGNKLSGDSVQTYGSILLTFLFNGIGGLMKYCFSLTLAILLILGIASCAPVTPATQEPSSSEEVESAEPYHPLTTQTGITGIDQVLEAVANGDSQRLRSLIEFTDAVCTRQDGLGGPPKCREGEAEGTPVQVLSFLAGEGSFIRKEDIGAWPGIAASGIYAVYEVNAAVISSEQYYPVGKYVILFVSGENQPAVALRIGERGIVRVDTIFDPSPENLSAMIEREASTVILAPKS
jgi:hypothetical protein